MFYNAQFQVHAARSCPKRKRKEFQELPMPSDRYFQNFTSRHNNFSRWGQVTNNSNMPMGSSSITSGGFAGPFGPLPLFGEYFSD